MAGRSFIVHLSDTARLSVQFETVSGEAVSFVVRLMVDHENGQLCVVRYDTAHGLPHKDHVNRNGGLVRKEWLVGMSFSDALCYAINDLRENYETYIDSFKRTWQSPE